MFVRCKKRFKDGKEHRYWSVVENVRVRGGRVVQRHVLYLGEINDSQRAAWCRSIEVVEGKSRSRQMALFPEDREAPALNCEVVKINIAEVDLHEPRQWGACWLALSLWDRLDPDRFWGPRLPPSRQGTRWLDILKIQACYRLIDPGSEWRLHRHWYEHSALRDLLGSDRAIADDTLYRCFDKLLAHKQEFFSFLRARWATLFDARFDVLLYDLTSTYFESDPPFEDKRRFGYPNKPHTDVAGATSMDLTRAVHAMRVTYFHWGFHGWTVYVVVGLCLAYFGFRKKLPFTLCSALHPIIGDRIYGPIGRGVDLLAVFGAIFGVAPSLGLGVN